MQRLKTIEFGSSTHNSPSFHPFVYANPDLEDILFSEISVQQTQFLLCFCCYDQYPEKGNLRKKGFIYLQFQATSPLLWGSQGRKAKHQMYSPKWREFNAWNLPCLLSASLLLSYSVRMPPA